LGYPQHALALVASGNPQDHVAVALASATHRLEPVDSFSYRSRACAKSLNLSTIRSVKLQ
jgi:hypothetical protein